jgi:hypothetical protein
MNKESFQKELKFFLDKINSLNADLLRLDGIISYLQNKIKELENSNLTNS